MITTGYSGTPLAKKLGMKEGYSVLLYQQPEHYFELFSDLPENLIFQEELRTEDTDFIHVFSTSFEELKEIGNTYKNAMKKNGLLWISWPKGASGCLLYTSPSPRDRG